MTLNSKSLKKKNAQIVNISVNVTNMHSVARKDVWVPAARKTVSLLTNHTFPQRGGIFQAFIYCFVLYVSLCCQSDRRVAAMATVALGGREQEKTRWSPDLFSLMLGWKGLSEGCSVAQAAPKLVHIDTESSAPWGSRWTKTTWEILSILGNVLNCCLVWKKDEKSSISFIFSTRL